MASTTRKQNNSLMMGGDYVLWWRFPRCKQWWWTSSVGCESCYPKTSHYIFYDSPPPSCNSFIVVGFHNLVKFHQKKNVVWKISRWQINKQTNFIDRYTSFPLCVKWGSKWFMIITHIWFIWERQIKWQDAKFSKVAWMFFKVAKKCVFLVF